MTSPKGENEKKGEVVPLDVVKAARSFKTGSRWTCVVSLTPPPSYPLETTPVNLSIHRMQGCVNTRKYLGVLYSR